MTVPDLLRHACPSLVLALATTGGAQGLTLYDGMDYGVTATNPGGIAGRNGGFGWDEGWIGADYGSLAAWWPLDNSADDVGPLGANGTMVGGQFLLDAPSQAVWSTHSLMLQKTNNEYVDLSPHASNFSHLMCGSITAWLKSDRSTGSMVVVGGKKRGTGRKLQFFVQNGTLRYYAIGRLPTGGYLVGFTPVTDGNWHHIAVTVDHAGYATTYVDGVFDTGSPQGFFGHVVGVDGLWIGQLEFVRPQRTFEGQLDDVAIWGAALTSAEVQALASLPPPLVPLSNAVTGPSLSSESLASGSLPSGAFGTFGLESVGNRFSESTGLPTARGLANWVRLNTSQTYYMSCLLRLGNLLGNPAFEVRFTNESGTHCRFGWNSGTQWIAGFDRTSVGGQVQVGQSYFAVFKIVADAMGTDTAYLKVYGPNENLHKDDSVLVGAGTGTNNWSIVHGGESISRTLDAMWLRPMGTGAAVEVDEIRMGTTWESVTSLGYGPACLGATIDKANRPAIGSSDFDITLVGASPTSPAFLFFGGSRTLWGSLPLPLDLSPFGAPGCSMLVSIDLIVPALTNGSGLATVTVPIPNQASLLGTAAYTQWASVDAAFTNPLPLAFSNAMEVVFEL